MESHVEKSRRRAGNACHVRRRAVMTLSASASTPRTLQSIMRRVTPRRWILVALGVQVLGLAFDAVWHGIHSTFEPATVRQMIEHLSTVHLPIYVGVVAVLVTTAWALLDQARRSQIGVALPVAFVGALVSTVGEAWHASIHLMMRPHRGPIAETVAVGGFVVVVGALWVAGRRDRRRAALDTNDRRAA